MNSLHQALGRGPGMQVSPAYMESPSGDIDTRETMSVPCTKCTYRNKWAFTGTRREAPPTFGDLGCGG